MSNWPERRATDFTSRPVFLSCRCRHGSVKPSKRMKKKQIGLRAAVQSEPINSKRTAPPGAHQMRCVNDVVPLLPKGTHADAVMQVR